MRVGCIWQSMQGLHPCSGVCECCAVRVQIGRMGAVAIAKAVAGLPKLERLELDENQISEDGIAHLKVRKTALPSML